MYDAETHASVRSIIKDTVQYSHTILLEKKWLKKIDSNLTRATIKLLLVNLRRFISLLDLFPLAPANRPWVSDDDSLTKGSHNTGNFMPYSFRTVCGFLKSLSPLFFSIFDEKLSHPWIQIRKKNN